MAYYPDLTRYDYSRRSAHEEPNTLNVGWLEPPHPFPQGEVSEKFLERLWAFCRYHVIRHRGFHTCEFCELPPVGPFQAQRRGETLSLGWAESRVFGQEDQVYAAPNLIYHYVVDHHYLPPQEFIQAVLDGPLPESAEYQELLALLRPQRSR